MRTDALLLLLLLLCITAALEVDGRGVARQRRRLVVRKRRLAGSALIKRRRAPLPRPSVLSPGRMDIIDATTMLANQEALLKNRAHGGATRGNSKKPSNITQKAKGIAATDGDSYSYAFAVDDRSRGPLYRQEERRHGETVDGHYDVLLPDNRIMTVTYHVNSTTGFQPTITFQKLPETMKNFSAVNENVTSVSHNEDASEQHVESNTIESVTQSREEASESTTMRQPGTSINLVPKAVTSSAMSSRRDLKRVNDQDYDARLRYVSRVQSRIRAALRTKSFSAHRKSSSSDTTARESVGSTSKPKTLENTRAKLPSQAQRSPTIGTNNLSNLATTQKNIQISSTPSSKRSEGFNASTEFGAKIHSENVMTSASKPESTGLEQSLIRPELTESPVTFVVDSRDLVTEMTSFVPNIPSPFTMTDNAGLNSTQHREEMRTVRIVTREGALNSSTPTPFSHIEKIIQRPASWPGLSGSLQAYRLSEDKTRPQKTENTIISTPFETFRNVSESVDKVTLRNSTPIQNDKDQPLNKVETVNDELDIFLVPSVDDGLTTAALRVRVPRNYLNRSNASPPPTTAASAVLMSSSKASTPKANARVRLSLMKFIAEKMDDKALQESTNPKMQLFQENSTETRISSSPFFRAFSKFSPH